MKLLQLTLAARPADPQEASEYDAAPSYPKFGTTVAKFRKLPRTPENIEAHADALFAQLRTMQRADWKRNLRAEPENGAAPCASGTWLTDGRAICRAIQQQQAAGLARALVEDHATRTDRQVGAVLAATLAGKEVRGIVRHYRV